MSFLLLKRRTQIQKETGRSAVELLGTLAVMGMLSVVGVSMYTAAMDKSKANTLIQEAQKRAVIVAGQIGFNNQTPPSLAEFSPYNTTSSGTFGEVITKGLTNQFGIQVSAVPKSICQNILNTIGDKTPIRRLSYEATPTTPITTCKEEDDFLFVYNNDMTGDDKVEEPRNCRTVNDCKTSCATCEIEEGEETGTCREECEEPTKLCTVDTECNQTNECMVCDTEVGMCKDGCERVEYLESNGTQYIDTGLKGKNGYNFDYKVNFTSLSSTNATGVGGLWEKSKSLYLGMIRTNYKFSYHYQDTNSPVEVQTVSVDTDYVVSGHLYSGSQYVVINGDKSPVKSLSGNFTSTINMWLFGLNSSSPLYSYMKMYYCKVYDNGTLVRDFVPVIAPDKKACMFDKVSKGLFCDANGRTFKTNLTQE